MNCEHIAVKLQERGYGLKKSIFIKGVRGLMPCPLNFKFCPICAKPIEERPNGRWLRWHNKSGQRE